MFATNSKGKNGIYLQLLGTFNFPRAPSLPDSMLTAVDCYVTYPGLAEVNYGLIDLD